MKIVIFDTETTSLEKPFCYNIGYNIVDTEKGFESLVKKDFVIQQVWHNPMLFATAYYAEKRAIYVSDMRARRTRMDKYGYIMQEMNRDFRKHEVQFAFAYNSPFDEKVIQFNSDWYKCINPFDTIPILDIRGYAHVFLCDNRFKIFCEKHERFTPTGNYSTTAETMFQYIMDNPDFIEDHTALSDSIIETEILKKCVTLGAVIGENYPTMRSIEREIIKELIIKMNGKVIFDTLFKKMTKRVKENITTISLKD